MAEKWTLLQMTQSILESMDSDDVNSIDDTDEASRVAKLIKEEFYGLLRLKDWPFSKVTKQLTALADTTQPVKMKIPDDIYRVDLVKYNKRLAIDTIDKWGAVCYYDPHEFIDLSLARSTGASNIITITTDNGTPLLIRNDVMPSFYTAFDDTYIYMDAYVASLESTLQSSKSLIYGMREPAWVHIDSFIPDMPARYFTLLLETARRVASKRIRQLEDSEAELKSRNQYNRLKVSGNRTDGATKYYNWGYRK